MQIPSDSECTADAIYKPLHTEQEIEIEIKIIPIPRKPTEGRQCALTLAMALGLFRLVPSCIIETAAAPTVSLAPQGLHLTTISSIFMTA